MDYRDVDYVYNQYGAKLNFNEVVLFMDDDIREDLHMSYVPCSCQLFFDLYCDRHLYVFD